MTAQLMGQPLQQPPAPPTPLVQLFNHIAPPHAPAAKVQPSTPAPPPPPKTDARLPLEVTASIQKLYLPPPPMNAQGSPGLDPQPGWGGKGR